MRETNPDVEIGTKVLQSKLITLSAKKHFKVCFIGLFLTHGGVDKKAICRLFQIRKKNPNEFDLKRTVSNKVL